MSKELVIALEIDQVASAKLNALGIGELCIFPMYQRLLGRVSLPIVEKVVFDICGINVHSQVGDVFDGVVVVSVGVDFDRYEKSSCYKRKSFWLEVIDKAMGEISVKYGWGLAQFKAVQRRIKQNEFEFKGVIKPSVVNKLTKASARLEWSFFDKVIFSVRISRLEDAKALIVFACAPPSLNSLKLVSSAEWLTDSVVRVWHSNKKDCWDIDVNDGKVEFSFARALNGDLHAMYDLANMYLDGGLLLPNKAKGIALLRDAAAKGYKRAQKKLARLVSEPQANQ